MPTLRTAAAAACALALLAAPAAHAKSDKTVDVQVLALNDFHGQLEALDPEATSSGRVGARPSATTNPGVAAGGVEFLATHVRRLEATNPKNTTVVSSGDLIGASPLISALFHDEPTIEAMNDLGLDIAGVGNHEFDEGAAELRRMQEGGCHPTDGCAGGDGEFDGADFRFTGANVIVKATGEPFFPAFKQVSYQGAKVAYIGMTLEGTPQIVAAAGVRGLEFRDEADTVDELVPVLRKRGIETIVVLLHEGGTPDTQETPASVNGCGVSGPIVDIVERASDEVDLWLTGHTHRAYNCVIDGDPVASAFSLGRVVTDVDMTISKATGEPTKISVNNEVVTRDVPRDEGQTQRIAFYRELSKPIAERVVGDATAPILRAAAPSGESPLGNLIADAQLAATDDAALGGAVAAFMNPGGVRADLLAGPVTYGEVFAVQPFGNNLTTITMTGAQVKTVLEQQFRPGAKVILQPAGITYTYDERNPIGSKVDPASLRIGGMAVMPGSSYRITVNSFLADGGDSFPEFTKGTNRLGGVVDTDAFEAFLAAGPVSPPATNRITKAG